PVDDATWTDKVYKNHNFQATIMTHVNQRDLVGSGSSQVGVTAAMRARDAAQPTAEDLAAAEERVVVIRRNWTPREDLPRR
ncbi:hypothetical protein ABT351_23000, partial [Micromonospora sp. NPDC000018]